MLPSSSSFFCQTLPSLTVFKNAKDFESNPYYMLPLLFVQMQKALESFQNHISFEQTALLLFTYC